VLPAKAAACFAVDLGLSCDDEAKAKTEGTQICSAKGVFLTKLSRSTADKAATCLATCCPPPPLEICSWVALGDGSTCISNADLKTKAAAACSAQRAEPRSLYPSNDCPGGTTIAKLECCASDPDAPAPPVQPPAK
jgi:hypothetical protein